jgi:hypothetical protein
MSVKNSNVVVTRYVTASAGLVLVPASGDARHIN